MAVYSHTGQCVRDLDRARTFYTEVLGFEQVMDLDVSGSQSAKLLRLPDPVGLRAVYLRRDGFVLELLAFTEPAPLERARPPGHRTRSDPHLDRRRRPGRDLRGGACARRRGPRRDAPAERRVRARLRGTARGAPRRGRLRPSPPRTHLTAERTSACPRGTRAPVSETVSSLALRGTPHVHPPRSTHMSTDEKTTKDLIQTLKDGPRGIRQGGGQARERRPRRHRRAIPRVLDATGHFRHRAHRARGRLRRRRRHVGLGRRHVAPRLDVAQGRRVGVGPRSRARRCRAG